MIYLEQSGSGSKIGGVDSTRGGLDLAFCVRSFFMTSACTVAPTLSVKKRFERTFHPYCLCKMSTI